MWIKQFGQVRYQDHLTYHYLGGVVKALLGENERAIEMLEIVSSLSLSFQTPFRDVNEKLT